MRIIQRWKNVKKLCMEDWKMKYEILKQQFDNYTRDQERFVHIVVHDLDSPLRKLSTWVDRFVSKNKDLQDESLKYYVNRIENSLGELRSIIDSLQHLSNISVDHMEMTKCDLKKIVARILGHLEAEIAEKNASFEVHDLPVVQGNENQYFLLFKNLFDNNIKFSRRESPLHVKISSELVNDVEKNAMNLQREKNYYKVIIEDNGIGFQAEHKKDIFKPFFRLHSKSEIPGSGLGLSICKRIVENHKGLVHAESTENGSRFVLILSQSPL
jgi:light-regulated signal transduction histidine kinase (bacteriophytochrome)